jgi:hypothetical protein
MSVHYRTLISNDKFSMTNFQSGEPTMCDSQPEIENLPLRIGHQSLGLPLDKGEGRPSDLAQAGISSANAVR